MCTCRGRGGVSRRKDDGQVFVTSLARSVTDCDCASLLFLLLFS